MIKSSLKLKVNKKGDISITIFFVFKKPFNSRFKRSNNVRLISQLFKLADIQWHHPLSGQTVMYSTCTLERWYYKARGGETDVLSALRTQTRKDKGKCKVVKSEIRDLLKKQYTQHESWNVQLHYDNLIVDIDTLQIKKPSYSSVLRYMRANNFNRKNKRQGPRSPGAKKAEKRLQKREVRSFEVDYVNGLWHLDFHHGSLPVLNNQGEWVKPILLAIIDDRSRLICHLQWYYSEDTECLVHGFCQALQKRAVPRSLMTDNGSAMISSEFTRGLLALGIEHKKTLPYSAYQNGKQETFWTNVEGRLLAMLEHQKNLSLRKLNYATQVWIEGDYHQKNHEALKQQTPINCYMNHQDVGRPCPDSKTLHQFFRKQTKRKQRHSDGTISLNGKRFEIPNPYLKLTYITVRYPSWDLSNIDMVNPDNGDFITSLYPLNKSANANGKRRQREPETKTEIPIFKETPSLMEKLLKDFAATGLPQMYIPKDEIGEKE